MMDKMDSFRGTDLMNEKILLIAFKNNWKWGILCLNQIRRPSARCHWGRENITLTRFDFPIYSKH